MFVFLTILILIAAILLIVIVVVQNSKGGGLASGFATGNSMMGVRKTTDFLEKTTWVLTGIIIVLSIASAAFMPKATQEVSTFEQEVRKGIRLQEQSIPNLGGEDGAIPLPLPNEGAQTAPEENSENTTPAE